VTAVVPEVADAVAASRERRTVRRAARRAPSRARPAPAPTSRTARHEGPSDILPSHVGPGPGPGGRGQAAGPGPRGPQGAPGSRAARARSSYARQASYVASNASLVPGNRNYQGIILAEYVTALIIMLVAPLAGGNAGTSGASPYTVADLKRIVAASAVYFFTALASGGNRGKYAAMFGGLMLLAILIAAANAGALNDFFTVLGAPTGTGQAAGTDTAAGRGSGG
jgi:hypothetical protein